MARSDDEDTDVEGGLDPPGEQPELKLRVGGPRLVYRAGPLRDYEEDRERTRTALALILAVLLAAVAILIIVLTAWHRINIDEAKDLAASVLSPVVAVTGAALGFYFGGSRGGDKS